MSLKKTLVDSTPPPGSSLLYDAAHHHWWYGQNPCATRIARSLAEVMPILKETERLVRRRGWSATAFIAYEAAPAFDPSLRVLPDTGFPLLHINLYHTLHPVRLPPVSNLPPSPADPPWKPSIPATRYRRCIQKIHDYIRQGDTYQVNYTFRLLTRLSADPWIRFRLLTATRPPYAAWMDTGDWILASASPELFFRLDGNTIWSRPMKGTAPRGLTSEADLALAETLRHSAKDRAENVMILDMVRNDLGRIAIPGTVHPSRCFTVEQYPTVWQMTSTVRAQTRAGLPAILEALFPPASITGAPKVHTMEIIAELETRPRRIYTGAMGWIRPGNQAQFNVAIRTLLVNRSTGQAEYGVGGGIVWDSTADREYAECATKARILSAPVDPPFHLLETLRWTPGAGYDLRERHLERLRQSARYFGYRCSIPKIQRLLDGHARKFPPVPHRVRLCVSATGHPVVQAFPMPESPVNRRLRVALAPAPVDASNRFLYHKTTCRAVYETARQQCPGYDDVILWNNRREITESTIANIAVRIGRRWITPPVACGLLPGTFRAAALADGWLHEAVIPVDALRDRPSILLMNSVRGRYRVHLDFPPSG